MLALFQNEIGYSHGQIATSCVPSPFSNVNQTTLQHCLPHYEENIAPVIGASFVSISVFSFRFPFPVSISSFRFISISCFSICPTHSYPLVLLWHKTFSSFLTHSRFYCILFLVCCTHMAILHFSNSISNPCHNLYV